APSPWPSPGLATGACPPLDHSVSTASSVSSESGRSRSSRLSWGPGSAGGRRGYMRPQATTFADSAKNRESVMSLGTIAHLQYYFARTGLLEGKGGQLARPRKTSGIKDGEEVSTAADRATDRIGLAFLATSSDKDPSCAISDADDASSSVGFVESPVGEEDDALLNWQGEEPMMLPPTVSTYNFKSVYVPPPPDVTVLRRELREAMEDARKVVEETEREQAKVKEGVEGPHASKDHQRSMSQIQGYYEVQGLHLLDIVTLAIRAAKNYYLAHEQPARLYSIKSERDIRSDLYQVLDILKRIAARNFSGGIRQNERESILTWAADIERMLELEHQKELAEEQERERYRWREGDWTGNEREREWLFLKTFVEDGSELPTWTDPEEAGALPTPFLETFQDGLRLVRLHNALVRRSRRHFEEIKVFHTDTAKPYRCAENLRYWIKSAELRWEVKLKLDVMQVVHGTDEGAWKAFDQAILTWCKGVREEITKEW
ncbi:hypothetical protein K490DRAFT_18310, partial [Saccharata proteae CBS 121410]